MSRSGTSRTSYDPGRIERLLTLDEVAEALVVSRRSVRRHADSGALPTVKVGRCVRVAPEDLRSYIDRHREAPSPVSGDSEAAAG